MRDHRSGNRDRSECRHTKDCGWANRSALALDGTFDAGPQVAAQLSTAAGDNPDRLSSKAAWRNSASHARSRHRQARPPDTISTPAATAEPTTPPNKGHPHRPRQQTRHRSHPALNPSNAASPTTTISPTEPKTGSPKTLLDIYRSFTEPEADPTGQTPNRETTLLSHVTSCG